MRVSRKAQLVLIGLLLLAVAAGAVYGAPGTAEPVAQAGDSISQTTGSSGPLNAGARAMPAYLRFMRLYPEADALATVTVDSFSGPESLGDRSYRVYQATVGTTPSTGPAATPPT